MPVQVRVRDPVDPGPGLTGFSLFIGTSPSIFLPRSSVALTRPMRDRTITLDPNSSHMSGIIDVSDLLAEGGEIERHYAEWQDLVREESAMAIRRKQDEDHRAGIAELELLLMKLETELKGEIAALQAQLTEKRLAIERYRYATTEHEYDSREYRRWTQAKQEHQDLVEQGIREKLRIDALEKEIRDLEETLLNSRESGSCPVCHRPLNPAEHDQVEGPPVSKLNELKGQLRTSTERIAQLRERYVDAEKELRHLEEVGRRLVISETRMSELKELENESEKLREQIEAMQGRLRTRAFGRKEQKAIMALESELRTNRYDAVKHRELQERMAALAGWKWKKDLLDWVKGRKTS